MDAVDLYICVCVCGVMENSISWIHLFRLVSDFCERVRNYRKGKARKRKVIERMEGFDLRMAEWVWIPTLKVADITGVRVGTLLPGKQRCIDVK